MELTTLLQLVPFNGNFKFHAEKGADITFGSESISEIKLNKKYKLKKFEEEIRICNEDRYGKDKLSGKIVGLSQTEIELRNNKELYVIPYTKISEISIKA